jgi:hypothetical protein
MTCFNTRGGVLGEFLVIQTPFLEREFGVKKGL